MTITEEQLAEWERLDPGTLGSRGLQEAMREDDFSYKDAAYADEACRALPLLLAEVRRLRAAPVGYTQAMAVAEAAWRDGDGWMWDGRNAESVDIGERCAAIVTRAIGTSAQVAEAERAVHEAALAWQLAAALVIVGDDCKEERMAVLIAANALRRAREEASR